MAARPLPQHPAGLGQPAAADVTGVVVDAPLKLSPLDENQLLCHTVIIPDGCDTTRGERQEVRS